MFKKIPACFSVGKTTIISACILMIILLMSFFYQTAQNSKKGKHNNALAQQNNELTAQIEKINQYAQIQKTILIDIVFAKAEIPVQVRIDIEKAIKETNDNTLSTKWQNFAESKSQTQTQTAMEDLLEYLAGKVVQGSK